MCASSLCVEVSNFCAATMLSSVQAYPGAGACELQAGCQPRLKSNQVSNRTNALKATWLACSQPKAPKAISMAAAHLQKVCSITAAVAPQP